MVGELNHAPKTGYQLFCRVFMAWLCIRSKPVNCFPQSGEKQKKSKQDKGWHVSLLAIMVVSTPPSDGVSGSGRCN